MTTGELLTRITIWLSIVAYTFGVIAFAFQRDKLTRLAWTIACVALLVHVVLAFQFFHDWSHTSAYIDTARQTREVVGWNSGAGLYINYALMIGWFADVGWWWIRGLDSYRRRPRWAIVAWHAFLFFIIFNATVVFGGAFARWAGVAVCPLLGVAWWMAARRTINKTSY